MHLLLPLVTLLAAPVVPDDVVFEPDLEYSRAGGESLRLDLARPRAAAATPRPAVVCVHGGGFRAGTRDSYHKLVMKLAQRGYVAVTVTYRLAPKHPFPGAVEDVKAAVRWLKLNADRYDVDPGRIGVTGGSAGGHLAAFTGLTGGVARFDSTYNPGPSSRVAAVVAYYPPSDLLKSYDRSVDAAEVLPLWLGGNRETARRRHVEASPLHWVTPDAPPTLVVHGTDDRYVEHAQGQWLVDRLRAAGAEAELLTLKGAGHGFKGADAEKAEAALFAFFDRHLRAPGPEEGPRYPHQLPPHIARLTDFGERPDFSPDGKRLVFVEKPGGDVFVVDIATKRVRPITRHYDHAGIGYYRALYLANGDVLLTGGRGRGTTRLYVLDRSFTKPPVLLGPQVIEGPAVSRKQLRIAWGPDKFTFRMADIVYDGGGPALANDRVILQWQDIGPPEGATFMETQAFRPRRENELIFAVYGHGGTEVFGVDLRTRKIVNHSKAPRSFDEPEGIFPDGRHTLIESNRARPDAKFEHALDIWKLALDGSGRAERLTFIGDDDGWVAANPVVSDDGRFMAFSPYPTTEKGVAPGRGMFLFDLRAPRAAPAKTASATPAR